MSTPTQLRSQVAALTTLASRDLTELYRLVTSAGVAREALNDILPALIETYGAAAAAVAADWYDEARDKAEVPGRFVAIPAEAVAADLGAAALAGYAVGPLTLPEPDFRRSLMMAEGGLQRRVANVARETVTTSSIADPGADGWMRAGTGECAFCSMLIGRGAVYTERGADFASHDHCNCAAVPAFGGQPRPVKPFTPSPRKVSDADRARVREYLRTH